MAHNDLQAEIARLKAENERLVVLLEKHGIAWEIAKPAGRDIPSCPPVLQRVSLNTEQKIALFRSLFRGRTDVYPARWESAKGAGYSPVCVNEWKSGVCQKPKVKCSNCDYRDFSCVTDPAGDG